MKLILTILLAAALLPAFGASVTLYGTAGNSCAVTGSPTTDRGGNITYYCTGVAVVTPVPVPPTLPVQPAPTRCSSNAVMGNLGPAHHSLVHRGQAGVTYSFPLPKNDGGLHNAGFLTIADDPAGGASIQVEVSISKCPGDTTYADAPEAQISIGGRSSGSYGPCKSTSYSASGGIRWSLAGSATECKVDNTAAWYLNIRYVSGCNGTCPIQYSHIEQ